MTDTHTEFIFFKNVIRNKKINKLTLYVCTVYVFELTYYIKCMCVLCVCVNIYKRSSNEIFYLKCKNLLNVITVINLSLKTKLLFS